MYWLRKIKREILYRWRTRHGLPWNAGYEMTMWYKREALSNDLKELQRLSIKTTEGTSIMRKLWYVNEEGELIIDDTQCD